MAYKVITELYEGASSKYELIGKRHTIINEFNSIWSYLRQSINFQPDLPRMKASHREGGDFGGAQNIKEMEKHYYKNWPELNNLESKEIDINIHEYEKEPDYVLEVAGGAPDVGEFLSGNPECMYMRVPQISERLPVVNFVMNIGMPHYITVDKAIAYRKQVAEIIFGLENMGIRCGIQGYAKSNSSSGKFSVETIIDIKAPDQQLDLYQALTVMSHPGTLRLLEFSILEQVCKENSEFLDCYHSGYGIPADADLAQFEDKPDYVYIPKLDDSSADIKDIVRNNGFLKEVISFQNEMDQES